VAWSVIILLTPSADPRWSRSLKAWVYGRSSAGSAGLNPPG